MSHISLYYNPKNTQYLLKHSQLISLSIGMKNKYLHYLFLFHHGAYHYSKRMLLDLIPWDSLQGYICLYIFTEGYICLWERE